MKKLITVLCMICMLMGIMVVAHAEEAEVAPVFVDATIVTEVLDEGQTIVGIRVEYDKEIAASSLNIGQYAVLGYENKAIYVNNSGEWDDAAYSGKYVFVEFAVSSVPGNMDGKTLQNVGGSDELYDLTLDVVSSLDGIVFKADGYIHLEIDDYITGTYANDAGEVINYRLFIPEGYETKSEDNEDLPMVIWLHGAGEIGTNNISQLAANRGALNFSDDEAQAANPCFVFAPQTPVAAFPPSGWDVEHFAIHSVAEMIGELGETYNIDAKRVYVAGCSMGSKGVKAITANYPELIAGALLLANPANKLEGFAEFVTDIPMWFISAEDDPLGGDVLQNQKAAIETFESLGCTVCAYIEEDGMNGYLRGLAAAEEMQVQVDAANAMGADKLITAYLPYTVITNAHASWMPGTDNTAVHAWLFSQVKE